MKKFNFEKFGFHRNIFFLIFFAFILFVLFFATLDVHAAGSSSSTIPYNVSVMKSYNNIMLDRIDIAKNYFYQVFPQYSDYSLLIWTDDGYYTDFYYQYIFMFEPEFNSSISDSFDFTSNSIEFYSDYEIFAVIIGSDGSTQGILEPHSHYASLMGNAQSVQTSVGAYLPRYPFYYDGDPIVSNNGIDVLVNISVPTPTPTGHATQPNNDPNNLINGSNGNPISRPTKPTPSPFTPSLWNPPSIDTSTIETLLESIWECLEYGFNYLKDNLSGWFSNLLSNLDSWFGYLVDSIFYTGNKIVQSIQDLATDLYNNFVSLFEPFFDFLASVVSFFDSLVALGTDENGNFSLTTFIVKLVVPDPDDLAETLLEADAFGIVPLFNAVKTFISSFFSTIFNLQVSKVFTIPSFTAFGTTFPSYQMDFSWFDDYKNYSDAIISAFLVIGYAHWFFIQLAPMLRGGGVVAHDQSTDPSKKVGG